MGFIQPGILDAVVQRTFATWNPAATGTFITLSAGNLTMASTGGPFDTGNTKSTINKSVGKWYWEITVQGSNVNDLFIGVCGSLAGLNTCPGFDGVRSFGYIGLTSLVFFNSAPLAAVMSSYAVGDVIGVALDKAGTNVQFYVNGVASNGPITIAAGIQFAIVGVSGSAASQITANFGASPFAFAVPAGFNPGLYS